MLNQERSDINDPPKYNEEIFNYYYYIIYSDL